MSEAHTREIALYKSRGVAKVFDMGRIGSSRFIAKILLFDVKAGPDRTESEPMRVSAWKTSM